MACEINASPSNGLVQSADGSGVIKLQSNGKTTNALAWVNFNGVGTVSIRNSYNVSSITDNGNGNYTINFTTAMSGTTYVPVAGCDYQPTLGTHSANRIKAAVNPLTSTTCGVYTEDQYFTTPFDCEVVTLVVFGN
jgi:hypothetical protein